MFYCSPLARGGYKCRRESARPYGLMANRRRLPVPARSRISMLFTCCERDIYAPGRPLPALRIGRPAGRLNSDGSMLTGPGARQRGRSTPSGGHKRGRRGASRRCPQRPPWGGDSVRRGSRARGCRGGPPRRAASSSPATSRGPTPRVRARQPGPRPSRRAPGTWRPRPGGGTVLRNPLRAMREVLRRLPRVVR
jgi:hypothetical protein